MYSMEISLRSNKAMYLRKLQLKNNGIYLRRISSNINSSYCNNVPLALNCWCRLSACALKLKMNILNITQLHFQEVFAVLFCKLLIYVHVLFLEPVSPFSVRWRGGWCCRYPYASLLLVRWYREHCFSYGIQWITWVLLLPFNIQWNLSITTTSMIKFTICDLFSNVF